MYAYSSTYHPSLKPSKLDEQDMHGTAGETKTNSGVAFSYAPFTC